jgi:hypothetical protein
MTNQLYQIRASKPKCFINQDGNIIIDDLSSGALSFSWTDLPSSALVTDSGRAVYNLSCGTYTLKIYNISKHSNEVIYIDLSCADQLSIDLVHVDEIKCYNDNINMFIEWSGGLAPYTLQINNDKIIIMDTRYDYSIQPNQDYRISIIDSNGCIATRETIRVMAEPVIANIRWEPITTHNGISEKVFCSASGGKPPYKIAWFKQGESKPLLVNQDCIRNKFKAGLYSLTIIDNNGCRFDKDFEITQPPPIAVNITSFNDYSTKALFDSVETQKVYNLILLPDNSNITDDKILNSTKIYIQHNKNKIPQNLCMDYGKISIDDNIYRYYYVFPGLSSLQTYKPSTLIVDDIECDIQHKFGNSQPKLVIGSLIMRNDYGFAYKNNDIVRISSNDKDINIQIDQVYIKTGLYLSNNIYTIINAINSNLPLEDGLVFINNNEECILQSLTTKSNNRLGSIICYVSNGDKNSLRAILINENEDKEEYNFNNTYTLTINNLRYGKYKLIVQDKNGIATTFNNQAINEDYFIVKILDSDNIEREESSIQSAQSFNLDPKILNVYNYRPNKLLFYDPEFKNGVLMNISPLDACYEIVGKDINIQDCGYKILENLPHGKYSIKIFKDGYKTENVKLFFNTKKDLVTAILQKESK